MPQSFLTGGIGIVYGIPQFSSKFHIVGVHFEGNCFDFESAQAISEESSSEAVSDDHHMITVPHGSIFQFFRTSRP